MIKSPDSALKGAGPWTRLHKVRIMSVRLCARSRILFANADSGCDSVDVTSVQLTNSTSYLWPLCKGIFLNFDHIFAACLTIYGKMTITFVWSCIWVWSYKIWPYIWLWPYISNNFDHIFEFDHISDSSLIIIYLILPILSVLECHVYISAVRSSVPCIYYLFYFNDVHSIFFN